MSATKDDGSAGALTKSGSNDQPIASGAGSQLQRIMALGSYFVSGTMAYVFGILVFQKLTWHAELMHSMPLVVPCI